MSFTHLHLLLNHFPVIGAVLGIALLGGQVRHTEVRSGVISSASASQANPD